ncbi:MAG: vitamin K epoxide reductase family protein [Verrucomicrobia bacterium]|nr:vitamin K epoxide reductase family protein [Verrucomicrobiota bacterium]
MDEKKKRVALLSVAIGFWLIAIPLTFEFKSKALLYSDILSGILLIVLGVLSLAPRRVWSGWSIAVVGVWLQLAPLVFWAPTSLNYLNDTLIGVILIAFSFYLISNRLSESESGTGIPDGWSYNPSSWLPRILTVGLAMLCWTFSRYLASYQLGYINEMWDPIFGNGSLRVITSKIANDFPVSDAGLGAFVYTMEFLLGWHGGSRRWHTMPWLVFSFGILVVPVGLVSIVLIILQPVAVGAWCSWCLAAAACMLTMILLSGSEIIAAISFIKKAVEQGDSFWKVLWKGKKLIGQNHAAKPRNRKKDKTAWGFYPCWNLVLLAVLGAYLMLSPYLFSMTGTLATVEYIIGPFMITFSVVAMVEVYRIARFVNSLFGILLIAFPIFWANPATGANWSTALVGLLALGLSIPRGVVRERYGSWDRYIV